MGKLKDKAIRVWADDEIQWRTLQHNKSKDFVRRALNPKSHPVITKDARLPKGYSASHQMGSTTMESGPLKGKHIAYPNITTTGRDKKLDWPNPRQAVKTAVEKGEYIEFKTAEEADQFARKYKRGTSIR
ncbi:MAG: hypothetical protein MN733_34040 [Nitrososphaera sp.]|nr:hypothetical protein [Nitrososphaera sp.]